MSYQNFSATLAALEEENRTRLTAAQEASQEQLALAAGLIFLSDVKEQLSTVHIRPRTIYRSVATALAVTPSAAEASVGAIAMERSRLAQLLLKKADFMAKSEN